MIIIKEAMDRLRTAMDEEPDYAYGWYANLNMNAQDCGASKEAAEKAAENFMSLCFDVKMKDVFKYMEISKSVVG